MTDSTELTELRLQRHHGSCHCGAVRFEADLDTRKAGRCNCTACMKIAGTTQIIKPAAFTLTTSEDGLGTYAYARRTMTRYFCKTCGVHVFARGHIPQLGGDFVSVSLNCLDDLELGDVEIGHWDGRHDNWMAGTRPTPWPIAAT